MKKIENYIERDSPSFIECALYYDTFGCPIRGVRYVVNISQKDKPIQWGYTDMNGAFLFHKIESYKGNSQFNFQTLQFWLINNDTSIIFIVLK